MDSLEMEYTAFTTENTTFIHERWSSTQLLMRDRVHSIYSREMEWVE